VSIAKGNQFYQPSRAANSGKGKNMELLESIAYDNANYAQKAEEAREAAGEYEDDGYESVEVRDLPDIVKPGTALAYQDGGHFEIWGEA
jgi:hypothetical protein